MNEFAKTFSPSDSTPDKISAIEQVLGPANLAPAVGIYNGGWLCVLAEDLGTRLLRSWPKIGHFTALLTTGFGDVFFWNAVDRAVYFLNVQYATTEFVDHSIDWVCEDFLTNPEILEKVFRVSRAESLKQRLRPLRYGEAFIREPWMMFGGPDRDDFYAIGRVDVYVDLVGQTHGTNKR
ncbi:MAG: hypothetical protein QOK37_1898 [Thermoanaerobaculia bacterium]|jgi:hypothetical protein|nr:hypothetical protein [Thermoanaerobaculia bacterium]